MAKNKSIGEPVKVSADENPTPAPAPAPEKNEAATPAEQPAAEASEPAKEDTHLAEIEKLKAELAAREAEIAEREKRLKAEEKALKKMSESLDEKLQANPQAQPDTGVLFTDLNVPADIRAGAQKGAPPELRRRYRDWVKKNHNSIATLKPYRVLLKGGPLGRSGREIEVLAVDPSDARRQAAKRLGVVQTEATTALVEAA